MTDQECLIALGANLPFGDGPPVETCRHALIALAARGVELRRISRFFRTPAFPAGSGPDYVNAAFSMRWSGSPEALLALLQEVEQAFERTREVRWGARTLDLDILAMGASVVPDAASVRAWMDLAPENQANRVPGRLLIPHPRMQDRGFVLVPLCDIAPGWRHPLLDQTAAAMLAALDPGDLAGVKPL